MACRLCGDGPEIRETEHFFLKFSAFEERLQEWVAGKTHWKPNVRNFTRGYLDGGLHDRAITRDIEWGVPVPLEGYRSKRIYVWFEAVIGYLSASKEWARTVGAPERWREFWQGDCRAYYFMGKDNILFHTVIWPAMLMGSEGLNLPYDVPANEFLNLEGLKLSTSRNWAVWLPDYLDRYEPDPLRYVVASNMPETSDSDFSWKEYVRSNNDELVATYGNLVHRVLTMTVRNFDGRVPARGPLDGESEELLDRAESALGEVGRHIESCSFRLALGSAMDLAHAANRYLDRKEPWRAIRSDRDSAAGTLWAALAAIKLPQDPALPVPALQLREAPRHAGAAGRRSGRGVAVGPGLAPPGPQATGAQAALRQAGGGTDRTGEPAHWQLGPTRPFRAGRRSRRSTHPSRRAWPVLSVISRAWQSSSPSFWASC